jgi:hypothetical protein
LSDPIACFRINAFSRRVGANGSCYFGSSRSPREDFVLLFYDGFEWRAREGLLARSNRSREGSRATPIEASAGPRSSPAIIRPSERFAWVLSASVMTSASTILEPPGHIPIIRLDEKEADSLSSHDGTAKRFLAEARPTPPRSPTSLQGAQTRKRHDVSHSATGGIVPGSR